MSPSDRFPHPPHYIDDLVASSAVEGPDIRAAIGTACRVGELVPAPGGGRTAERWSVLAALARVNVTVARVTEAHTDALAILDEADHKADADRSWGVFASEAGPPVTATLSAGRASLTGTKHWCSLGGVLDAALVTARTGERTGLFAVDLQQPGVTSRPDDGWVARGLPTVTSVALDFADADAVPVGDGDWYLTRPGFAWGGMGVAACWFGAAQGLADRLRSARADDVGCLHAGRVDLALHAAGCVLADAATRVDAGELAGDAWTAALQVRAVVADAAETVVRETTHALGPAPLAFDAWFAAQVADLQMYVRQHHGERDVVDVGRRRLQR